MDDPSKQAQDNGWQVRKGEKGTQIEYWQFPDRERSTRDEEPDRSDSSAAQLIRRIYTVFNAKQIDDVPALPAQNAPGMGGGPIR